MARTETHQPVETKQAGAKAMSAVDSFSLDDETRAYARKLFKRRVEGWGDEARALEECASWTGMTPRSFKRLITGETKQAGTFFSRVRKGYLDYCARKVAELQNEIQAEKARYGNVRIGDLDHEVEALVAKVEAARAVKILQQREG
ncbi:hypothetical protein ABID21_001892 [Pseudorhizobium tarimense]|uniref:Uncharacterized protein n=1 Tax=Pseudorhizobium tarimense TaxID=1079109 RepID=A0ABV2H5H3_9HYPH|nr:hypothetical protein [Pseudorhizobium tarimense]MCJ8518987.1 hypothetical protein [Pseudorhizobium tarimense]